MRDNNIYFDFDNKDNNDSIDISSSSSAKKDEFEDIVSDSQYSHLVGGAARAPHSHSAAPAKGHKATDSRSYRIKRWWARLTKGKKAALISLTSIILVLCIALGWFFIYFNYNYQRITGDPEDLGFSETINDKIINVALFGIDTRDKESFEGNSDSIMIMSLNTVTKKVKIISVMRDTLVPIEKNGKTTYNKINSAYGGPSGGPEVAIKTLNKCFNLDISEYATVNFFGMADIIDAVGGIEVTLTQDEISRGRPNQPHFNESLYEICKEMNVDIKDYYITTAGTQHLNGIQAVAYSRLRYVANVWGTNNDYGRTDRQRYVMEQLFNKAASMGKSQYVKLAKALIPCTETSLSYGDIMSIAFSIMLHSPKFEQARIPQTEFLMDSPSGSFGSVVYYDLDYAAKAIHGIIYDDLTMEEFIEQNPVEKNDWYSQRFSSSGSSNRPSNPGSSVSTPSSKPEVSDTPSSSGPSEPDESQGNDSSSESELPSSSEAPGDESSGGEDGGSEVTPPSSSEAPDSGEDGGDTPTGGDTAVTPENTSRKR